MLYEERDLTENQARQIIGDRMNARINILNEWLQQNGYTLRLHSTYKDAIKGILSKGLHLNTYSTIFESAESKGDLLEECTVSERDLIALEEFVLKNKKNAQLNKQYETYSPGTNTIVGSQIITAKQLLGYSHNGGTVTVVFCVPRKKSKKIGREIKNDFFEDGTQIFDPYLRRTIKGSYQKHGDVKFSSKFSYPQQGILFVYDREKNRILLNNNYDEEYFLDETTPQKGYIHRGDILNKLKNIDDLITHNHDGKSR